MREVEVLDVETFSKLIGERAREKKEGQEEWEKEEG
jgi:hypothetical protein